MFIACNKYTVCSLPLAPTRISGVIKPLRKRCNVILVQIGFESMHDSI